MIQTTRHQPLTQQLTTQLGSAGPAQTASSGLAQVMNKFGQEQYQQYIQGVKANEYLRGMQEAAAGKSVQDIESGLSVVDRIFGMTDAAQAARAYHVSAESYKVQEEIDLKAAGLAALPPDEARQQIQQILFKPRTGDTATDTAITQRALSLMPQVFQQHAKAHEAYNQNQARAYQMENTRLSVGRAASVIRQATMDKDSPGSQEMILRAAEEVRLAAQPVPGQDLEMWQGGLFDAAKNIVTSIGRPRIVTDEQGNRREVMDDGYMWQALEKSGLLDALSPSQYDQIQKLWNVASNRVKMYKGAAYVKELATWKARSHVSRGGTDTARRHYEEGLALSNRFAQETGIERLLSDDDLVASTSTKQLAITRKQERVEELRLRDYERRLAAAQQKRDEEDKKFQKVARNMEILAAFQTDAPKAINSALAGGFPRSQTDDAFEMAVVGNELAGIPAANFDQRIGLAKVYPFGAHPSISGPLQYRARTVMDPDFASKNPDSVMQIVQEFDKIHTSLGPELTALNYGSQYDKLKRASDAMRAGEQNPLVAARIANQDVQSSPPSDVVINSAVEGAIDGMTATNWVSKMWNPLSDEYSNQHRLTLKREAARLMRQMPNHEPDVAARFAVTNALSNMRTIGDWGYISQDGIDPVGWMTQGENVKEPLTISEASELFGDYIHDKLYGETYWGSIGHVNQSGRWLLKNRTESVVMAPVPGRDGKPVLMVEYIDENGREGRLTVSAQEVYDRYPELKEKRRKAKDKREAIQKDPLNTVFTPSL